MKIVLINLCTKNDHAFLNLGILYIASSLLKAKYDVEIIDLVRNPLSYEEVIREIKNKKAELICFSGIVTAYYQLEPLSNLVKQIFPDIPLLLGGSLGESSISLIEKFTPIDFVAVGEWEGLIVNFIETLKSDKDFKTIPNLYYRNNNNFIFSQKNKHKLTNSELDRIDFPPYHLIDVEYYISYTSEIFNNDYYNAKGSSFTEAPRAIPMVISRGCPYNCSFCYRLIKNHRHHSIDYVIKHLRYLKESLNINLIALNDELVFYNKKWFIDLCNAIAESDLNIAFAAGGGRVNIVTKELLSAMKQAGFIRISYGIESGSQTILDAMNKQTTVDENYNALKWTYGNNLISHPNFIFGHPGENKKTIKETIAFIKKIDNLFYDKKRCLNHLQIWYATPYPGTPLYEESVKRKLIKNERDYIMGLTSQDIYRINLSQFNSKSRLFYYVNVELAKLNFLRLLQGGQIFKSLFSVANIIFLYFAYFFDTKTIYSPGFFIKKIIKKNITRRGYIRNKLR